MAACPLMFKGRLLLSCAARRDDLQIGLVRRLKGKRDLVFRRSHCTTSTTLQLYSFAKMKDRSTLAQPSPRASFCSKDLVTVSTCVSFLQCSSARSVATSYHNVHTQYISIRSAQAGWLLRQTQREFVQIKQRSAAFHVTTILRPFWW